MGENLIRGNVRIEIDGSGLNAKLVFTPQEDGEEWTRENIFQLLTRNSINEGIDSEAIDNFLKSPPKEEEASIAVAHGTAPEPAVDEEVEWKDLPIPEELSQDAERFFSSLPDPEIVQVRIEKVKKQKKVEKKQKLGFLPPKEEIVTVVEKQEIPEKIDIDPKVEDTGWVEEGEKIAVIYPGENGKPGKDIYGNQLKPEKEPQIAVYPGKGTEKKRGELTARETGFLRRGNNWAEVIPFSRHEWNVHLGEDKVTCLIDFTPGSKYASLPDVKTILEAAESQDADKDTLIGEGELKSLLEEWKENDRQIHDYPISSDLDSSIDVSVSDDNMKAVLTLRKGRGRGKSLNLKEVGTVLRTSGVKGFTPDKVKKDILEFYRSTKQSLEEYVLVEGTPPEEPEPQELQFSLKIISSTEQEEIKKLLEAANHAAQGITSISDFPVEAVEEMAFAVRHQPVAALTVPQKGKSGKDVYGKEIPPQEALKPQIVIHENIKEEEGKFVAEISGLLEKGRIDDAVHLRIRPHRDAEIDVIRDADNMKAFLTIKPAEGAGRSITEEDVRKRIQDASVVKGINEDAVNSAIAGLRQGEPIEQLLIAEGQPPKNASKNQINFKVEIASDKNVAIRKDGRADFKNIHELTTVTKGQLIAEVDPPEEKGEDGWDITGKVISARSFQGFDLELGENVTKEDIEGGGFKVIAGASGKLMYDKKKIDVEEVHTISGNVGIKTGNIKFNGAVQIKGDVESGFSVISGDSIQIGGNVDGALISADGEVVINQGVKGAGKAVIRTKDTIKAGFIEHARLLSVKDVIIKNFCLHSVVKCNGTMSLLSDKGHCIGGSIRSKLGMEVMNLGSEKGVRTEVFFGQDYLIADQIEIEEREIQKIKDKLLTFDVFMLKMEKQGERDKLEKARKEKLKLMKIMEKRSLRLFTLREKFEEHFPSEIKIKGTLFPGVVIESHGRYYEAKQKKSKLSIVFNLETGQLEEKKVD